MTILGVDLVDATGVPAGRIGRVGHSGQLDSWWMAQPPTIFESSEPALPDLVFVITNPRWGRCDVTAQPVITSFNWLAWRGNPYLQLTVNVPTVDGVYIVRCNAIGPSPEHPRAVELRVFRCRLETV